MSGIDRTLGPGEMKEFNVLSHSLDPKTTLDELQESVYNEALYLGDEYVKRGYATWRPDFDEAKVNELVKKWKSERNSAALSRMFGKYSTWLSQPGKML